MLPDVSSGGSVEVDYWAVRWRLGGQRVSAWGRITSPIAARSGGPPVQAVLRLGGGACRERPASGLVGAVGGFAGAVAVW